MADARNQLKQLLSDYPLNTMFIFRFTANKHHKIGRYFRTTLRANKLHKYLGSKNAITAIKWALNNPMDKDTKRFKSRGRIEFWTI